MKQQPLFLAVAIATLASSASVSANSEDLKSQTPKDAHAHDEAHHIVQHQEHRQSIEEVIVSASPLDKTHANNARPAAVLSGDQLRNQAAATLGETLKSQLGVSSASFGPGVGTPVIRGQQGNRVKVMQDNLGTSDAANASSDHANAVEAMLAERIEVLRGPQTLRYGNGAIGGVINVIDNRIPSRVPQELNGSVETRHSNVNDETATVFKLEGGSGQLAWHVDGLYRNSNDVDIPGFADQHGLEHPDETSNGFIANSDSQSKSWTAGLAWIGDSNSLGLSVNKLKTQYGIPTGAHTHEGEDHEDENHDEHDHEGEGHEGEGHDDHEEETPELVRIVMEQTRYDLKGLSEQPIDGIKRLSLRLGFVDYEHQELEGGAVGTQFLSEASQGRIELVHNDWLDGDAQGAFGLQFMNKDFSAIGDEAFIPASTTRNVGAFIIEEWQQGSWVLEAGARLESNEVEAQGKQTNKTNTHGLSLSAQYQLDDQQQFNWILSRSQRAPSVEELFSDGVHVATQSYELGNDNLNEETSHNLELNYKLHMPLGNDFIEIDANAFYNDINDFIYRANTGQIREGSTLFRYQQQGAEFKGYELKVSFPIYHQNGVSWDAQLFTDTVRAQLDSGENVPRITPKRMGAQIDYHGELGSHPLDAQLRFSRVSKQDKPGLNEEPTNAYNRLDAQLNYRIDTEGGEWLFFARGDNLLDADIRNAASFLREVAPEAGRGITVGGRYSF